MYFEQGHEPEWMKTPESISEQLIKDTAEADVVIIGAGYAGVLAARAAAEKGAKVIVLEKCTDDKKKRKQNFLGGSEWGAFNSRFGIEHGVPEYDPVDFLVEFEKRSLCRCNQQLVRRIAFSAGPVFDWFIEPLPEHFKEHLKLFNPKQSEFSGNTNGFRSFAGTVGFDKPCDTGNFNESPHSLVQAMLWTCDWLAEKGVDFRYNMAGEQLEKTGERVTAVIARDGDGEYHRFVASKYVVLAAGDFSRNKDMVYDLLDELADISHNGKKHFVFGAGRDGSGIRMGIWAGGHIEAGPRSGMYSCSVGRGGFMGGLRLNSLGERFSNEAMAGSFIAATRGSRQPEGFISAIYDSQWPEFAKRMSYDHGATDIYSTEATFKQFCDRHDKAIDIMNRRHNGEVFEKPVFRTDIIMPPSAYPFYAADTLEELGELCGFEGEGMQRFLESIRRYNELCELGKDLDFGKDAQYLMPIVKPPFFAEQAMKDAGGLMVSEAGLVVDEFQRVLDDNGKPVPGLLATGQCAGEIFPVQYCPPMSGCGVGTCTTLGKLAGDFAAD